MNEKRLRPNTCSAGRPLSISKQTPVGRHGVILAKRAAVNRLPGFAEGHFSVQDAAAQLAAPLLLEGLNARRGRPDG
jgi:16S rRNA C967 or C1407 C5-methylase (RsmB/RsmF family)